MSPPLRVLSLTTMFPRPGMPGNFGGFVARQFQALVELGEVELTVINPVPRAPWTFGTRAGTNPDTSRGYPVHAPRFTYIPKVGGRWNPALITRAVLPLARELHRAQPFDLIDAQFFYPDGPAAAAVARDLHLPLSIKARGSDISYWGRLAYGKPQVLAAADQAGGSLAVSAALKTEMAELGMDPAKLHVHYTGLDHAVFHLRDQAEARAALAGLAQGAVPPDGRLLVCTGNLVALKGQALVIEALAALPDTRLIVAGNGPDEAGLRALAARMGLTARVHFGGFTPANLATALCAADAMVLPSEREGLANAWIEALACGTPLVITDTGSAREVLTDPAAGYLVARTPDGIAAAVRAIFDNPPDRAHVAACAAGFSWQANARQLTDHYRRLVDAAG